jgi:ribulose-5-phosphate 4-epimerase/fuculose-1-phosphate aldolase
MQPRNVRSRVAKVRSGTGSAVSGEEWRVRVDLAACYRMVAHLGWDDLVFTHISARVPGVERHFLINPYGFMFDEVTASSLVKVDLAGNIVMPTEHTINPAGYVIHSAVHEARDDAHCVLHVHTLEGVAVSCQRDGLLPLCQASLFPLGSVAYHDYEGVAINPGEKRRLVADLGSCNFMILRNHGLLTCGRSVAEAFLYMYSLQAACATQLAAQASGAPLVPVAPAIVEGFRGQAGAVLRGLGADIVWPGVLRKVERLDPSFRE